MAAARNGLSQFSNLLSSISTCTTFSFQQVRQKANYANHWMRRDDMRRQLVKKHALERLCYVAMKRNDILPVEIKTDVEERMTKEIPRQTALRQLTPRCIITSRPRGVVHRYRVSRIVFRDFADAAELAGVQRAMW